MGRRRHLGRVAAAILVVGLLVAGCGGSEPDVPPIADLDLVPGQDVTVEGVVVENSVDPCRFPEDHDEPCVMDGAVAVAPPP